MTTSTGCRVVARSVETRALPPAPRRWWIEQAVRAAMAVVLAIALCGALLMVWTGLS